jgi:hypothetical protein
MTKWQRLRKRIKDELGITANGTFKRLYPGFWQRSAGAMSWITRSDDDDSVQVGSAFTVTQLLKANKIGLEVTGAFCAIQPVKENGSTDYSVMD